MSYQIRLIINHTAFIITFMIFILGLKNNDVIFVFLGVHVKDCDTC